LFALFGVYLGPELACSGGMGGWDICGILRGVENARSGVLSFWARCLNLVARSSTLYMLSIFVWRIPESVLNFEGSSDSWCLGIGEDTGRRLSGGLEI
jgi:hypothetical protein